MVERKLTRRTMALVLMCLIAGLVIGDAVDAPIAKAEKGGCEMNACSLSSGNCFLTDFRANCSETADGCHSTAC
jgi:hypothetical protein